jgi:hypothetical protein
MARRENSKVTFSAIPCKKNVFGLRPEVPENNILQAFATVLGKGIIHHPELLKEL